jgi:methyltransferase family protein
MRTPAGFDLTHLLAFMPRRGHFRVPVSLAEAGMGDVNRAIEFADFLHATFPDSRRIADIAGGHGELSFWLHEFGHTSVVIDPRPSRLPPKLARELRKRAVRTGEVMTIERRTARIEEVDLSEFDLIAALHPDQATEPAIRAAVAAGVAFAVVPCCVFAADGRSYSREGWIDHLAALAPGIRRSTLPISGARTVLWHPGLMKPMAHSCG